MPWYIELNQPVGGGTITAVVVEFPDDAAYTKATNTTAVPKGGYPTKGAAQAVADKYNGQPDSQRNQTTPPNIPVGTTGGVGFNNPVSTFSDVAHALSAFYTKLTDGKMWRSLGWLILGIALILAGLILWIGPAAVKASPVGRIATLGR